MHLVAPVLSFYLFSWLGLALPVLLRCGTKGRVVANREQGRQVCAYLSSV